MHAATGSDAERGYGGESRPGGGARGGAAGQGAARQGEGRGGVKMELKKTSTVGVVHLGRPYKTVLDTPQERAGKVVYIAMCGVFHFIFCSRLKLTSSLSPMIPLSEVQREGL